MLLAAQYWPLSEAHAAAEVAWCESRGKPHVVGAAGEHGLWQIIPAYWNHLKPEGDGFAPRINAQWAHEIWKTTTDWRYWTCQPATN